MDSLDRLPVTTVTLYVIVVIVAVVSGLVLAPLVWNAAPTLGDDEEPTVAVVTLRGGTSFENVNAVARDLRQARSNSSIEAVVLRINSPGGPVSPSEKLYLAVNQTASEMPVVAYVEGTAASGGYFGIAPADEIIVKPSSTVGSIGVVVQAPLSAVEQVEAARERFVRSGPDKAQITKDGLRNRLETLQGTFVSTIMKHRGDELTLSREQVAHGDTYLGAAAVENGFADRIGDQELAIQRAAALSEDIEGDQYDVAYVSQDAPSVQLTFADSEVASVDGNIVYVERG
ncbi:MAG: S49 family peptidase, partial [Haloarculaceae archaeon]